MTRNAANSLGQPSLKDLTVRFLATCSDAAATAVETGGGDVEPHEVATGFRVDPQAAWNDATRQDTAAAVPLPSAPPPEWAALVNQPASAFAVPMALGHFPQRVRDLQPLLTNFVPSELRPSGAQEPSPGLSALRAWIGTTGNSHPVLAGGLARLIGDFGTAERLLTPHGPAHTNETAALLWQRGQGPEALAAWNGLPDSPAVQFNRGMALLFLGKIAEAKTALTRAIAALPEESGWNALARLYLAVAEIHG